jgi:hypothetical protein
MGLGETHPMARMASGTAAKRWRERLARWRSSGLSVRRFCLREGVSEPSFYLWRKRLAGEVDSRRGGEAAVFVPVHVVDSPRGMPPDTALGAFRHDGGETVVEVALPGGVTIRVGPHVDEPQLRTVLRAVVAETGEC